MPGMRRFRISDVEVLASKQLKDRLVFTRKAEPDDIAAYVHSGGTTGSPKLVRLTHRGFSYKFWANTLVMAHTADDVIFADYPMFHIAGFFGRGIMANCRWHGDRDPGPGGARDKRSLRTTGNSLKNSASRCYRAFRPLWRSSASSRPAART